MKIKVTKQLDRALWLQYLQSGEDAQPQLIQQMDEAERLLLDAARVRWIYRVADLSEIPMEGISITRHLEGCDRTAVLAVTIGSGIDELIRRYEIRNMAMAMVLDTGASVLAEQAADEAERMMKEALLKHWPDRFCTPRFSPGYGDYPIHCQRQILACVDAGRKIGITLTAEDMMVPHKSITAVVGLADHPVKGRLATCEECLLREKCALLKEGKHC